MTTRIVDEINIGLMLVSCLFAFVFPFQLFLFSYAVLGPLHYYTEIPWLRRKQFFTTGKFDAILLGALCIASAAIYYAIPTEGAVDTSGMNLIAVIGFTAFFGALAMTAMKSYKQKIVAVILIAASSILFQRFGFFSVVFASFIPTIVHVYLFTAAFILFGALRHKSPSGLASLGVFAVCTIALFVLPNLASGGDIGDYVRNSYIPFSGLNFDLMSLFGFRHVTAQTSDLAGLLFYSDTGIIVMRFVAFSYTYHFLNWFSKTSVIKWHQISRRGLAIVFALWVASLALYASDYELGFRYLYFVSLLHVMLEFPLNQRTFIGIGQELRSRIFKGRMAIVQD